MTEKGSMSMAELVKYYNLTGNETAAVLNIAREIGRFGDRKYELLDAARELLWSGDEE
jgi:hypothetical protein